MSTGLDVLFLSPSSPIRRGGKHFIVDRGSSERMNSLLLFFFSFRPNNWNLWINFQLNDLKNKKSLEKVATEAFHSVLLLLLPSSDSLFSAFQFLKWDGMSPFWFLFKVYFGKHFPGFLNNLAYGKPLRKKNFLGRFCNKLSKHLLCNDFVGMNNFLTSPIWDNIEKPKIQTFDALTICICNTFQELICLILKWST